ncbi:MAG: hypothetical protein NT026_02675 [Candidatus Staskawiczbacteria bacterium]|nr:hypothetical protein [Candidatus Staskawiczbacteria bacterium]
MKKIFAISILSFALLISFLPLMTKAAGLVTCSGADCTINKFFEMLVKIYNFLVLDIATPLAIIALIVGAIFMLVSAGNPNLHGTGKKIIYAAIIGLALVFCSYLIINFILVDMLGFKGNWASPF